MTAALQPLLSGGEAAAEQLQEFDRIHRSLQRDYAVRAASAIAGLLAAPQEPAVAPLAPPSGEGSSDGNTGDLRGGQESAGSGSGAKGD